MGKEKEITNKNRIAIVHDHLGSPGGGERTVLLMALNLQADFITAYVDQGTFPDLQKQLGDRLICLSRDAVKVRGARFFWLRALFRKNRSLFKQYDILIASSQAATEAVAAYGGKRTLKAVYTHTPPRRVFDQYEISKNAYPYYLRGIYALFALFWKYLYLRALSRLDLNIANSENIRKRLKYYTGYEANAVVWPPVMIEKFKWLSDGDYFLSFGRNDEAKRIELIAESFALMPDKKLIICSGGPRLEAVKKIARDAKNITVLGWVSDEKLFELVGNCRAAVYIPLDEDAGMSHLEANAAGKPYLGTAEGGLVESTIDGETGLLLPPHPKVQDLIAGAEKMSREWCRSKKSACIRHAAGYAAENFYHKIEKILAQHNPRLPIFGIDASRWEDPRQSGKRVRTGVENYSMNIIRELVSLLQREKIRTRVYTPRLIRSLPRDIQKIIPAGRGWTSCRLRKELEHSPVDYFFTPSYYIPKGAPAKSYAVIHDVIFKSDPDRYALSERISQDIVARANIKKADKIFTVSEFSRAEIVKYYRVEPENIISVPMGYVRNFQFPISNFHFPGFKKILYIGRIEKKKSVDVLVRAFGEFIRTYPGWRLILAGKDGFGSEEIKELVRRLGLQEKISLPGFISDAEKYQLLSEASLFVHPSAREGSALPILEAFDFCVPAIAAGVPAMREVGSDAVLYFTPDDPSALAQKINELASDNSLSERMMKRGRELLESRSWRKSAEIILREILR